MEIWISVVVSKMKPEEPKQMLMYTSKQREV